MACNIDHQGDVPRSIGDLQDSQAGFWRHKCAGCAYMQGRREATQAEENLRAQVRKLNARIAELEAARGPKR